MLQLDVENSKALQNGINVHRLKAGTMLLVLTKNSLYKITKDNGDQYDVIVQGGKKFPKPEIAHFAGSTFGGSMMKIGWIGYGMHMEIFVPAVCKTYKTTQVLAARIIGDGYEYDMEWDKMSLTPKIMQGLIQD